MKIFLSISGVLLALMVFNIFRNGSEPVPNSSSSLTATTGTGQTALGVNTMLPNQIQSANEFSDLLSNLRSISIDTSIFSNPNYKALRENSIILGTDTVGRNDPFAPAGADITVSDSGQPTSIGSGPTPTINAPIATVFLVQTLSPDKITSSSALLSQTVNIPPGRVANIAFEYGTTEQFGEITKPIQVNISGVQSSTIKGLKSKTKYYVRAIGDDNGGSVTGDTMSFTTK